MEEIVTIQKIKATCAQVVECERSCSESWLVGWLVGWLVVATWCIKFLCRPWFLVIITMINIPWLASNLEYFKLQSWNLLLRLQYDNDCFICSSFVVLCSFTRWFTVLHPAFLGSQWSFWRVNLTVIIPNKVSRMVNVSWMKRQQNLLPLPDSMWIHVYLFVDSCVLLKGTIYRFVSCFKKIQVSSNKKSRGTDGMVICSKAWTQTFGAYDVDGVWFTFPLVGVNILRQTSTKWWQWIYLPQAHGTHIHSYSTCCWIVCVTIYSMHAASWNLNDPCLSWEKEIWLGFQIKIEIKVIVFDMFDVLDGILVFFCHTIYIHIFPSK